MKKSIFRQRNVAQAENIQKALSGRYQTIFDDPEKEIRRLSGDTAFQMRAVNPHSRNLLFSTLLRNLTTETHRIGMSEHRPIYFLTIVDRGWMSPQLDDRRLKSDYLSEMRSFYEDLIPHDLSYMGMIEPAMYVSCASVLRSNIMFSYHTHGLVWGCSEQRLRVACNQMRRKVQAVIPIASGVKWSCVRDGDLGQMVWYISKYPRAQYQLFRRDKNNFKQFKRQINGVNSVRLYNEMRSTKLGELTIGRGWGEEVLQRSLTRIGIKKLARAEVANT